MTTAGQFRRSVQRFEDYSSDLVSSDMNTFDDCLSVFIDYCERDPVFSDIHRQLMSVPNVNFDEWYSSSTETVASMSGSGVLKFPKDQEQRMSLMYELLHRIKKEEFDVLNFSIQFFAISSNKIDLYIKAFNDAITRPLVREITYRLQDAAEQLPKESSESISPTTIQIIHQATNVIHQSAVGNNITQTATNKNDGELSRLFDQLEVKIRALNATNEVLQERLEILESAREIATSEQPKRSVVKTLLGALPTTSDILSITSSIVSVLPLM